MNESPTTPEDHAPELAASMRRIVPQDMATTGLVAGARTKRNRRRGAIGAVAAAAIVALAVPVALNLPGRVTVAEPASTTQPSSDAARTAYGAPGAEACHSEDMDPSMQQDLNEPAPLGAVRAWLCGDYSPETGQGVVGPREPLTSGVDEIIEAVQAQEVIDLAVTSCLADYALSYSTVFEYEDGSRHVIDGELHGCHATYDGSVAREGGDEFYVSLVSAWREQRKTDTGNEWVVPQVCPGPLSLLGMRPEDTVQASVCGEDAAGKWVGAYLDESLVADIVNEFESTGDSPIDATAPPETPDTGRQMWLTLSDRYTDFLTWERLENGTYSANDREGQRSLWKPSGELATRLDAAFAAAGESDAPLTGQPTDPAMGGGLGYKEPANPAVPSDPPQPFLPEQCSVGGELPADLPDGRLPDGAESVWLCPASDFGIATPLESLTDADLVSTAVEAFNSLDPAPEDQACTMEAGPAFAVVFSYADGTRRTVELQEYGCRNVVGTGVLKADGDGFKDTLLGLWEEQRDGTQPLPERPGPLCPISGSILPVVPGEDEVVSGVACAAAIDPEGPDAGTTGPELTVLPEALVKMISAQLATPSPEMMGLMPTGASLVLLTDQGDPLVLHRLEDGSFSSFQNGESFSWTPGGEVATALDELLGG